MWVVLPFRVVWYGSIIGTPGVSLLDATIYFLVAYRGHGVVFTGESEAVLVRPFEAEPVGDCVECAG
jgi:hypothetical protein